ncbi:hypothetical protein RhiirA4_460352 [Rhizophagus irregularis]|uniref:Uncharacterized protein n=1 Tax=Rhizophagus irregularis TaxID=588596 RepID=A0A2I1GGF2_9GLOM|nr:hypothetical protein RhiirA4_460352 [Rhizophagus irregularis]
MEKTKFHKFETWFGVSGEFSEFRRMKKTKIRSVDFRRSENQDSFQLRIRRFLGVGYTGSAFGSWALDTDFGFQFLGFGYMDGFIDFLDSYLSRRTKGQHFRSLETYVFSKEVTGSLDLWTCKKFDGRFFEVFGYGIWTPAYNMDGIPDNFKIVWMSGW